MPTTPLQLALIASGLILMGIGCWLLFRSRRTKRESERLWLAGENPYPASATSLTDPTRLSVAVCCLILGYHLIAWAFPPTVLAVQLPRQWWWVWVLAGAGVVVASLGIDRLERRSGAAGHPHDHSDRRNHG